jgi:hypothetical protein
VALRALFWIVVGASLLANAVVLAVLLRLAEWRELAGGGAATLPLDLRAAIRRDLLAERPRWAPLLADLARARAEMAAAATARPYNPAAVEAAQARVRAATAALQEAAQDVMRETFAAAAAGR